MKDRKLQIPVQESEEEKDSRELSKIVREEQERIAKKTGHPPTWEGTEWPETFRK